MIKKTILLATILACFMQVGLAQNKKNTKQKPLPVKEEKVVEQQKRKTFPNIEIITSYGTMVVKLYAETPLHSENFVKLATSGFYDSLLFHRIIKGFMIQGGDPTSKFADSTMMLGSGDNGYKINPEFNNNYIHKRGALAAARDNNPLKQSSGCQFYLVQGKPIALKDLETAMNNKNLQRKQELFYKVYQTDSVSAKFAELQNKNDKDGVKKYFDELMGDVDKEYQKSNPLIYNSDQIEVYTTVGGTPHLDGDYTVFGEIVSGLDVLDKISEAATGKADRPIADIRMQMRILK